MQVIALDFEIMWNNLVCYPILKPLTLIICMHCGVDYFYELTLAMHHLK